MKYQLYTYDTWGNTRDGFEVNDVYRQSTIIDIDDKTTDLQIARRLGAVGCEFDAQHEGVIYINVKRNGKPIGELRALERVYGLGQEGIMITEKKV